ncbi:hypothetical protein MRX96_040462 [Rhipicephalus microplus]
MIVRKREVMERMFRLTLPKTEEKPSSTSIHTRQIKKFGKETDAGRKFQTNCTAVKRTPALFLVRAQSTRDTVVWDYLLDDKDRTDYEDSADEDAEARIHYRRNRHSSGPLSGRKLAAAFVFVKIVVLVGADEGVRVLMRRSKSWPPVSKGAPSRVTRTRGEERSRYRSRTPRSMCPTSPDSMRALGSCSTLTVTTSEALEARQSSLSEAPAVSDDDRALMFRLDDVTGVAESWSPRKERRQTGRFRRVSGKVAPTLILISFLRVVVRRAKSSARFARASNGNGESLDSPRVESNNDQVNLNFPPFLERFGAAATVAIARSSPELVTEYERIVSGALVPTTKVAKEYAEPYGHEPDRARAQNAHREIQPANATEAHQMREHEADACARVIGDDDFHGNQ